MYIDRFLSHRLGAESACSVGSKASPPRPEGRGLLLSGSATERGSCKAFMHGRIDASVDGQRKAWRVAARLSASTPEGGGREGGRESRG